MKRWVFVAIAVVVIGIGWYLARTYWRYTPAWNQPKLGKVTRGDIKVPVTAAGLIEPYQRIEIKPEASGEVIEVRVVEGDYVHKGDTLVVLKKDDEERNVIRAQAGVDRAKALLEQARIAVIKARANVQSTIAQIKELEANGVVTRDDLDSERRMIEREQTSQRALNLAQARHDVNQAKLDAGRAALIVAENNIQDAEQAVKIQEAALKEAQKMFEDSEERLRETTIMAPSDGVVTDVRVRVGNIVQSGIGTVTGGTTLLEISDISHYKVVTRVDESDYGRVLAIAPLDSLPNIEELRQAALTDAEQMEKRSGKVKLTVDAFPDDKFEGVITRVEPQGRLNQGSAIIQFDVHVEITDPNRYKLPLGTQAQVEFTVQSVSDALLVPAEAVKGFQEKRGVWIKSVEAQTREARPKFIEARFGITDGSVTQVVDVLGGAKLEAGQEVYTKLPPTREEEEGQQ